MEETLRKEHADMPTVYLAGSFKNIEVTRSIAASLTRANISCCFSEPGDPKGIQGCLDRIDSSDILYIVNPDGAIGKSVSLDLGYAIAKQKRFFSLAPLTDPPISAFSGGVLSPESLIAAASGRPTTDTELASILIALEKGALDRWGKGDPSGCLEISAPDVSYFDPFVERRIDGLEALTRYYDGLRGKIHVDRYELISPKVSVIGDVAVLTFNYVSYGGNDRYPWNCTEVYRKTGSQWRIIQTHWSVTKPAQAGA